MVPKAVAGNVGDGEDRELLEAHLERASKTAIAGGDGAGGGRFWADFLGFPRISMVFKRVFA